MGNVICQFGCQQIFEWKSEVAPRLSNNLKMVVCLGLRRLWNDVARLMFVFRFFLLDSSSGDNCWQSFHIFPQPKKKKKSRSGSEKGCRDAPGTSRGGSRSASSLPHLRPESWIMSQRMRVERGVMLVHTTHRNLWHIPRLGTRVRNAGNRLPCWHVVQLS